MLADHPDVFARLRAEVLQVLGPNGKVCPENLRELKYLRAILNGEPLSSSRQFCPIDNYFRDATAVPECVSFNQLRTYRGEELNHGSL